ncbi:hypothetical protein AB5I83_13025 [Mesobacillus sp. LC4]
MKKKLQGFVIIGALFSLLGVILTFSSVSLGSSMADSWLASRGGADTAYYHLMVKSYINSFLVAGGIMLVFGLMLTSLAAFKLMNIMEG